MTTDNAQTLSALTINSDSPSSPPSSPITTTTPSSYQAEIDSRTIMISNLPPTISETELKSFISSLSPGFTSLQLIHNHKINRKFAFVTYPTEAKSETAIQDMNCMEIGTFEIRIKKKSSGVFGESRNNVYIKGIPDSIRARHLFDVLGIFGTILSVKIPSIEHKNMRMDYGFVQFSSEESALKAIDFINSNEVLGVNLTAERYKRLEERHEDTEQKNFVLKLAVSVGEEELRKAFEGRMEFEKFDFKKPIEGKMFTICFVTIKEETKGVELMNAVNEINSQGLLSAKVKCEPLLPKLKLIQKRKEEARNTWLLMKKRNVFVKGFPKTWEESDLRALCEKYGEIESIYLTASTRDSANEKNAGYAFVSYKEENDASNAIENLNGMFLNSSIVEASQALGPHERKTRKRFEGNGNNVMREGSMGKRYRKDFNGKMNFGNFHQGNNSMGMLGGSSDRDEDVLKRIEEVSGCDRNESRRVFNEMKNNMGEDNVRGIMDDEGRFRNMVNDVMSKVE